MAESYYARAVFFVRDAGQALRFYTEALGFSLDWSHQEYGRPYVFQVSLHGFELILNQTDPGTADRPGHGRVFIGLDQEQSAVFHHYLMEKRIAPTVVQWGAPTLVIRDPDENELFFWLPEDERAGLEPEPLPSKREAGQ
jgi:catechol 2,3-dioxygenase-like lactoylglutathione lyase family enzyme